MTLFIGDCHKLLAEMPEESVDLIVSSPPYFMGKEYDRSDKIEDFSDEHAELVPLLCRVLRQGGSLCWQVGMHVHRGSVVPLDILAYQAFSKVDSLKLRNRIIWHFEHGEHSRNKFSGRHETILWFTKGDSYTFNLDAVRVPQKYPGKKHYKGPKKGKFSGNPAGKNPGDMWAVPNVKSKHCEKTEHPCQFPIAIPQRLIRALTKPNDLVFDPFAGVMSTGIAAALEGRRFLGCEIDSSYAEAGQIRYRDLQNGTLKVRPWDQPVVPPDTRLSVARAPDHFWRLHDGSAVTGPKRQEGRQADPQ
jgi:adenine-specific DNA-methyltransferase